MVRLQWNSYLASKIVHDPNEGCVKTPLEENKCFIFNKISHAEEIRIWPPKLKLNMRK